jgi:hypothetical protein
VEPSQRDAVLREVLRSLAENCVRLRETCYWAGASAIALEGLHHRQSFDLGFHTQKALVDVRPILAEIQQAFPGMFEVVSGPDGFGSGFKGVLRLPGLEAVTLEVLSSFEDLPVGQLVQSTIAPRFRRITVRRFLADKIQCIAERAEARDLVDARALLRGFPELRGAARQILQSQDALILTERLTGWSESTLREDLAAYPNVDPDDAFSARDLLLEWVREEGRV